VVSVRLVKFHSLLVTSWLTSANNILTQTIPTYIWLSDYWWPDKLIDWPFQCGKELNTSPAFDVYDVQRRDHKFRPGDSEGIYFPHEQQLPPLHPWKRPVRCSTLYQTGMYSTVHHSKPHTYFSRSHVPLSGRPSNRRLRNILPVHVANT
jgi:hypothetical protein